MLGRDFSFPIDWNSGLLRTVADLIPGKTPKKAEYRSSGDIKVIKFRDVLESGHVDFSNDDEGWIDSTQIERNDLVTLLPQTILLTNAAHSLSHLGKKIGFVEELPDSTPTCFVGELTSIRSKSQEVNTRWLYYLLQSEPLRREIIKAAEGAHLVPYWLRRIPLSWPKESEQGVVAETLKATDESIRAIEEEIRTAGRVKKALLQSVFLGQQQFRWGMAPRGWSETRLRAVLTEPVENGISPQATTSEPPGYPTLNVTSIRNGICTQSAISYIELSEPQAAAFAVQRGDFFVLRGNGNRDYIAIGGLLEEEPIEGLVFSDLLIRVPFDVNKANPRFMKYLWQAPSFLRRLQSYAITGSGLWKIGQRSINRFELALPDIPEQDAIAELFVAHDEFVTSLRVQLVASRRLKQSLLQNLVTGKVRLNSC
jgi:type I restriction enzyme S subunit